MRDKIKNNNKIKIISLLSSIFLWMYVMAVVDPEETKLMEGIPVRITNESELKDENLVIYPEQEITANVYITGNLSNIQKIKKEDIKVDGYIKNPIEGNSELYLSAPSSPRITYEFKNNVLIVPLEKVVDEKRVLTIETKGESSKNIDTINIENKKDSIDIRGPRTLVSQVQKVVGVLNVSSKEQNFSQIVDLKAVDSKGNEIEGIDLEQNSVEVTVTMLKEKEVPIKLNVENDTEDNTNFNFELSKDKVMIKGKAEYVDSITTIETEKINLSELKVSKNREINLIIPEGIKSDINKVVVNIEEPITMKEFVYDQSNIEIRNNTSNLELEKIIFPDIIEVVVEYDDLTTNINKSDLILYIDLQNVNEETKSIPINYQSAYTFKNISINPEELKINR